MRSSSRIARLFGGCGVMLSAALAVMATEPVLAASVRVQTRRISLAGPFSGPCTETNPGFSAGFVQESSVAVDPRIRVIFWFLGSRMVGLSDVVMASRDGGRSFSRILVPRLTACTGGAFQVASDPGVEFAADGRTAYFTAIVVDNRSRQTWLRRACL